MVYLVDWYWSRNIMFFLQTISDLLSTGKRVTFQEPENKTCISSVEIRDEALEETVTETPHVLLL